jgi:hypothetical protein
VVWWRFPGTWVTRRRCIWAPAIALASGSPQSSQAVQGRGAGCWPGLVASSTVQSGKPGIGGHLDVSNLVIPSPSVFDRGSRP